MKQITSDALGEVNRALGLTGSPASGETEFLDSVVFQGVDVAPIIRRGRTLTDTGGIFTAWMSNIHVGAGGLTMAITPYAQDAGRLAPWPNPMPPQFDIWYLGSSIEHVSGAGTLTGAMIVLRYPASVLAISVDDMGNAVTPGQMRLVLAEWDAETNLNGINHAIMDTMGPWDRRPGMRLRRHAETELEFTSVAATAAVTFRLSVLLGMFPLSLGQDGTE